MTEIEDLMNQVADPCNGAFLLDRVINRLRHACDGYYSRIALESMVRERYDVYPTPAGPAVRGWCLKPAYTQR